MFLFLDFDGVTHPFFLSEDLGDVDTRPFAFLPRIEKVLREFPAVRIVISSSWRETHSLERLRLLFSEDLRERVIGVTPVLRPLINGGVGHRQQEIESWLVANGHMGASWVALDDVDHNFLPGAPLLLCVDQFDDEEADALRHILKGWR